MAAAEDQYGMAKRRIDEVRIVELIEVVTAEGAGIETDPVQLVSRYFTKDGSLIAVSPDFRAKSGAEDTPEARAAP